MQMLIFHVGEEKYGFRLSDVSEVIRVSEVAHVPRIPPPFEGIFQLRGRVIALLGLVPSFWPDLAAPSAESEVLVLAGPAQNLAVRVPGLVESATIDTEDLRAASEEGIGAVLDGIVCDHQQIYHLLSASKLLTHARNVMSESEKASRAAVGG